jgi:hypothetical protein
MSAIAYGQHLIIVVEIAADQWRADIRRLDGQKIKTIGGAEFDVIPGKATDFAEDAVAEVSA